MIVMGNAVRKDEGLYTYADYKDWDLKEGERYELIDGEAYQMSAPTDRHQAILLALLLKLGNFLEGKPCKVRPAPYDVRLFYAEDDSDDTVVQPDISVICDGEKRGKEGCHGAPDLVIEILSPSNTVFEIALKHNLYLRAGVREYWVVDPEMNTVQVHLFEQGPTVANHYNSTDSVPVTVLPGLVIPLTSVFAV